MTRIQTIAQSIIVNAVVGMSIAAQLFALAIVKLMAVDTEMTFAAPSPALA